jgi:hypothetical protein
LSVERLVVFFMCIVFQERMIHLASTRIINHEKNAVKSIQKVLCSSSVPSIARLFRVCLSSTTQPVCDDAELSLLLSYGVEGVITLPPCGGVIACVGVAAWGMFLLTEMPLLLEAVFLLPG